MGRSWLQQGIPVLSPTVLYLLRALQDGSSSSCLLPPAAPHPPALKYAGEAAAKSVEIKPQLLLSATRNTLTAPCCHSGKLGQQQKAQRVGKVETRSCGSTFRFELFSLQNSAVCKAGGLSHHLQPRGPSTKHILALQMLVFPRCRSLPAAQPHQNKDLNKPNLRHAEFCTQAPSRPSSLRLQPKLCICMFHFSSVIPCSHLLL